MGIREIVGAFVGALGCYGGWRGLAWLIAGRRRGLRYWWPTAMLGWSWFMLWAAAFPASSGWLGYARDPLFIAFFGVNLPEAVVGNGLLGVLIDAPDIVKGSVASVAVWALWYGVIRFWESRVGKRAVVGLGIGTLE